MILSIHIPSTPDRRNETSRLVDLINNQLRKIDKKVELIVYEDNKEISIGEKRRRMYESSKGLYSWQIDSDDIISDDAIELIIQAIEQEGADCITFREMCIINGKYKTCKHSLKYDDWAQNVDGFDYVRTPFNKSVIKTEICNLVPVPDKRFGEDHAWSRLIKPYLKTETHIPQELYIYQYNTTPHNERYGIKL